MQASISHDPAKQNPILPANMMQTLNRFAALLSLSLIPLIDAAPFPYEAAFSRDILSSLPSQLSNGTSIFTSTNNFANESLRWSTWNAPTFSSIVNPVTEEDIIATVNYATANNITFFAQGGGHGYTGTLDAIKNAIMINMKTHFEYANFNTNDSTVTIGGGTTFSTLVNASYAHGRELTVGSSPCVGAIGAALSGGSGRLQGKHGLTQDALKSMRVVLANGTALDVSATQNPDLWWAMRGAGQSYGIVVHATFNTYPQTNNGSVYNGELILNGTKVEALFDLVNEMLPVWPAELAIEPLFTVYPGTLMPIIIVGMFYHGPEAAARNYTLRFKDLGGVLSFTENMYSWADLPFKAAGGAYASSCVKGQLRSTYSNNVRHFNSSVQREAFSNYTDFAQAYPDANGTGLLWEIFGVQGVEAVPDNSSAYANRHHVRTLGLLQFDYFNESDITGIEEFGKAWRASSIEHSGYGDDRNYVYTNYARGDEPLEALYGYEPWRLERLRHIKSIYDPTNQFKGYHDVQSTQ